MEYLSLDIKYIWRGRPAVQGESRWYYQLAIMDVYSRRILCWILQGSVRQADVIALMRWLAFSVPLLRRVPEPPVPPRARAAIGDAVREAFADLASTFRHLRRYRQAFLMLVAFLVYNDGIGTIIRMASLYGAQIGIAQEHLIAALLLVQFVGVPCSFLFGRLATAIGAKPAIFVALAVYAGISVLGYFMSTALHFYMLAVLVGTVQGGSQALSRSLFASMIPRDRTSQFFGFFAVSERTAGILGPLTFAVAVAVTGSSRSAILSVIAFFVVGGLLLTLVDVEEGRRQSAAAAV